MTTTPPTEQREMHILATWLDLRGLFWLHVPNEGKRTQRQGALLKRLGLKAGAPDVLILEPSPIGHQLVMIELKRQSGGRVSIEQSRFMARAKQHGWRCYVARGAEDAIGFLRAIGW